LHYRYATATLVTSEALAAAVGLSVGDAQRRLKAIISYQQRLKPYPHQMRLCSVNCSAVA